MRLDVAAPSLRLVGLSGSGIVTVDGLHAARVTVDLSGQGVSRASGRAARLAAMLSGGGEVDLDGLRACDAQEVVGGGVTAMRATRSVDATVHGLGPIPLAGRQEALHRQWRVATG